MIDIWHMKSFAGRTRWQPPRRIWEGFTGALNCLLQLKSGRILVPFSYLTHRSWARATGQGDASPSVHQGDPEHSPAASVTARKAHRSNGPR